MNIQQALIDLGLAIVVYLALLIIYRLYFHPLSKFPGPRWAAITDYWELYQDYFRGESGRLFIELDSIHEKYGPIVRIRPNEVHIKDSQWMDVLYAGPGETRDRDPFISAALGVPLATISTAAHNLHRMRREAISPFFSNRMVGRMESALQEYAMSLSKRLQNQSGEVLDLRVFFFAWTTDVIADLIFHNKTNLFWNKTRASEWYSMISDFAGTFPVVKHFPWLMGNTMALPLVVWRVLVPSLVPLVSVYKDTRRMAEKAVRKHQHRSNNLDSKLDADEDRDIFQTILESDLPPKEKSPKRMAHEIYNLLFAGSISTSRIATLAVYHILANPSVHEKLRSELFGAIPNANQMPSVRELKKLPVLTAIIKETLRLSCIFSTRSPMISPDKALEYNGLMIPAGSSISMTLCKAAIDPTIFSNPYSFRPERWLCEEQSPHDFERYVLTFGRGSRMCMGMHLAYAQLYLLLAGICRRCDLELFETIRERDIDVRGGGPLGEPSRKTKGVRVLVKGGVS